MVRRLQVKADEGLSGGCRQSVYKRISLLKSDAGPCDGHGGCSPCLPQSHLTESQMADFHDKPGRNPPIPHICHFFYTGKIFGEKIYTEKRQFFALNL